MLIEIIENYTIHSARDHKPCKFLIREVDKGYSLHHSWIIIKRVTIEIG